MSLHGPLTTAVLLVPAQQITPPLFYHIHHFTPALPKCGDEPLVTHVSTYLWSQKQGENLSGRSWCEQRAVGTGLAGAAAAGPKFERALKIIHIYILLLISRQVRHLLVRRLWPNPLFPTYHASVPPGPAGPAMVRPYFQKVDQHNWCRK